MATSASHALSIPEIVASVFQHFRTRDLLAERPVLRSCALVNSTWFIEASRLLWDVAKARELAVVEAPHRRQHYAENVRRLECRGISQQERRLLFSLPFRVLSSLKLGSRDDDGFFADGIESLLVPSLTSLDVWGSTQPPPEFWQLVKDRCQRLRSLTLSSQHGGSSSTGVDRRNALLDLPIDTTTFGFWDYLTDSPDLRTLHITEPLGDITTGDLATLMRHPGLTDIKINGRISAAHFQRARQSVADHFPSLHSLECEIEGGGTLDTLTSNPSNILKLKLKIRGPSRGVLSHLSNYTNLRALVVEFAPEPAHADFPGAPDAYAWPTLESEELVDLCERCSQLQTLRMTIGATEEYTPTTFELSDNLVERSLAKLTNLQHLIIESGGFSTSKLSASSLIILGRSCPNLSLLDLRGHFKLDALAEQARGYSLVLKRPLFPVLGALFLDCTYQHTSMRTLRILQRNWPRLRKVLGRTATGSDIRIECSIRPVHTRSSSF